MEIEPEMGKDSQMIWGSSYLSIMHIASIILPPIQITNTVFSQSLENLNLDFLL